MLNHIRIITLATALVLLAACFQDDRDGGRDRNDEQRIPAVEAVEIRSGTLPLEERLAGSVLARNQTEIFAEVAGRIVEVLAYDGDRVESGAPLVRLRDTEFEEQRQQALAGLQVAEARVKQAEASNARVQAALNRTEIIVERNLGSRAELEIAQAEALSAQAELQLMRAERQQAASLVAERVSALGETVIRAPITGVVGGRNAEVGQVATTGTPLFVIGDPASMRVTITLTQRMLGYIKTGTRVNVFPDTALDDAIEASISRISPFLHPVTRTTNAEIEVDQDDGVRLRPGMFVTVDVLYGESQVSSLVPNNAIYSQVRDGREGVYVASLDEANRPLEGRGAELPRSDLDPSGPVAVQFVPVRVVARGRLATAIDGVEPGQWVVTVGHHLLASSESSQAVVQPTPWDHIMRLQQMQSRDLLDVIRRRQGDLVNDVEVLN
jgi:RND family efflux transporter MFP subunit